MCKQRVTGNPRSGTIGARKRVGWILPDALLALSVLAATLILTQQTLVTVHRQTVQDQIALQRSRTRRDRLLLKWVIG